MPPTAMRCQQRVFERAAAEGAKAVVISAAIEAEIATLPADERDAFLADLGLHETGLNRMIHAGYELLGLITFFTAGPKESRAWTVHKGAQGARGGRRDPHRLRARLHPRRDHRLRRFRPVRRRGRRPRRRQDALRRQGLCRAGRRRAAVPLQRLAAVRRRAFPSPRGTASSSVPRRSRCPT